MSRAWPENETVREHLVNAETLLLMDPTATESILERVRRAIQLLDRQSLSEIVRPGAA
jgi:hypothetical protein